MSLFTKKPRMSVEEFCRSFYDSSIFHRIANSVDETEALWDEMRAELMKVDPSLAAVDRMKFHHEMTALRLELVALAFDHNGFSDDKRIRLATATRMYLSAKDHAEVLSSMGTYHDAVAESAMDIATGERKRGARAAFLTNYHAQLYMSLANRAHAAGVREVEAYDDIKRVVNRYHTDGSWQRHMTSARLARALAERLECSPNPAGYSAMQAFIEGMYGGAKGAIREVTIS